MPPCSSHRRISNLDIEREDIIKKQFHYNEKETKVNPTDINDAEFYDFVKSSRQMMMKEIGKENNITRTIEA